MTLSFYIARRFAAMVGRVFLVFFAILMLIASLTLVGMFMRIAGGKSTRFM